MSVPWAGPALGSDVTRSASPFLLCRFLIKPEGVTNRKWEGDLEGALVTYRSIAGEQGRGCM